jgi:hypothetical protein
VWKTTPLGVPRAAQARLFCDIHATADIFL